MARNELAQSGGMSEEGQRITERRERLKLNKSELARESGVHRDTIADIESGKGFQAATLAKLDETLTALEVEAFGNPDAGKPSAAGLSMIEIEVRDVGGKVRYVVRGHVDNAEQAERSAARLARAIAAEGESEKS